MSRFSTGSRKQPVLNEEAIKELEPMKLPGTLDRWTGNVLYPNEDSAVWDVTSNDVC